jgi:Holliday junction resolvase RusA-like endonuclease
VSDVTNYDPMAEYGEMIFTVPAIPVAQPRARATNINGHTRMYEAGKEHAIHAFKSSVRHAYSMNRAGAPLDEPLFVKLVFVFPRPQSMCWKTKPMPRVLMASGLRSDGDNLTKAVWDALNGIAYRDDGQIAQWSGEKWIAAGDEIPHVEITIRRLDP